MNKLLEGSKVINIIDNSDDIKYELKDGVNLVINLFYHSINKHNIEINAHNESNIVINYAGLSSNDNDINISITVDGNNNKVIVNGRFISLDKTCNVFVDTYVIKNTIGNIVEENLKGINENGMIMIKPILRIDSNEVNASHGASIGKFDKNELFYLKLKGINENDAKELLKRGFLYSLYSDNFINMLEEGDRENE
jgi:hypothetical protein